MIHQPVLLKQVIKFLAPQPNRIYLDATCGEGGYTKEILNSGAQVVVMDLNAEAVEVINSTFVEAIKSGKLIPVAGNFAELREVLTQLGIRRVDGVVMDLGLSRFLLESSGRGFSFQRDEPLIMSYAVEPELTAAEIVNRYPEAELARIFKEFGEEKQAKRVAKAIVQFRQKKKIQTAKELAEIVASVIKRRGRLHPATKIFQALRIEVNRELDNLTQALPQAVEVLNPGGRLVVVSYHSLEDRVVKQFFKKLGQDFVILTPKPVVPDTEESRQNPAARSAKLRAVEKRRSYFY